MASVTRITRVHNPSRATHRRVRSGGPKRRKVGAARSKAASTRRRTRMKARGTTKPKGRARVRRNPFLLEWATIPNPFRPKTKKRRAKNVKKSRKRRTRRAAATTTRRRRRANPKARRTHRRRRSTAMVVSRRRRRRSNPVAHVRRHRRRRASNSRSRSRRYGRVRRQNPSLFGHTSAKDMLMIVGGGLVGVAATKFLPTLLPNSLVSGLGNSSFVSIAITGAGAFVAGWLATRFVGKTFGEAVLFGGLMQTGSAILNAFAPSSVRSALALSGIGDIVATAGYAVPQNPVRQMPMPSTATGNGVSGFRRFAGR